MAGTKVDRAYEIITTYIKGGYDHDPEVFVSDVLAGVKPGDNVLTSGAQLSVRVEHAYGLCRTAIKEAGGSAPSFGEKGKVEAKEEEKKEGEGDDKELEEKEKPEEEVKPGEKLEEKKEEKPEEAEELSDEEKEKLKLQHKNLKTSPHISTDILKNNTNTRYSSKEEVQVSKIVGTPEWKDWSSGRGEKKNEQGLTEVEEDAVKIREQGENYWSQQKEPIKLIKIEGPKGPIYVVDGDPTQVAAAKLAEIDSVPAEVYVIDPKSSTTTDNDTKEWRNALIASGVVKGGVKEEGTLHTLTLDEDLEVPWLIHTPENANKINDVYEMVYGEGSVPEVEGLPNEVLNNPNKANEWKSNVLDAAKQSGWSPTILPPVEKEIKTEKDKEVKEKTEEIPPKVVAPQRNIAFILKPTLSASDVKVEAAKTKTQTRTLPLKDSGKITFNQDELDEISKSQTFKKPLTEDEVNTAWRLHNMGVDKQQIEGALVAATFLTEDEINSIDNITKLEEIFSLAEADFSNELYLANQAPVLSIEDYSEVTPPPDLTYLMTQSTDNGISPILDTGVDFVRDQVEGVVKDTVKKGVKKLVEKGVTSGVEAAGEAGVAAAGEAGVGAAAGGAAAGVAAAEVAAGPPGWVALAVEAALALVVAAGAIVVKGLQSLVTSLTGEKDTRQSILALSMVILTSGIGLGSPFLIGLGGLGFLGAGYALVGGIGLASGVFGLFSAAMLGITGVLLPSVIIPFLIGLIVLPFFVIIVVLIIYMGGYVVPQNTLRSGPYVPVENAYISIQKVANPDTVDNPPPNRTITYTITISALQGVLTNITFSTDCNVYGDGAGRTCPIPNPSIPAPHLIISPGTPFVITYTVTYNSNFSDSVVTDTFTVSADVPSAGRQTTSGSESVIIGEPPFGCFVVSDNAIPWSQAPGGAVNNLNAAISTLVSQYPAYAAKVCDGPPVNLCYDPPGVSLWGWHTHDAQCDIRFESRPMQNTTDALYILGHEAGHHVARINPALYSTYTSWPGVAGERPMCTYSATGAPGEAFAEAIALYMTSPTFTNCANPLQSTYPAHYNFVNQNVF